MRQTEISVRLALGGSRLRLIRQLLTESILLATLGATCGLLLAHWAVNVLFALVAGNSPIKPHLNTLVLSFTIVITMIAGILFGLAPAFSAGRADLATSLKAGVRGVTGDHGKVSAAHSLIVAQIAISLVLLVGANLFARSLLNLEKQPLGFDQSHVLLVGLVHGWRTIDPKMWRALSQALRAIEHAARCAHRHSSPIHSHERFFQHHNISIQGHVDKPGEDMSAENILVGPSYAETMGMTLLQGREIGLQTLLEHLKPPWSTKLSCARIFRERAR